MDEMKKDDVENLEVEVLSDSDLESVAGGNVVESNVANACCIGSGKGADSVPE